jgi:hypothetical protein
MDVEHYRNMMKAISEIEYILHTQTCAKRAIDDITHFMSVYVGYEE